MAEENLKGARLALDNGLLRVAASRAYYAVYAAMWGYVGDPPEKRWSHGGVATVFLRQLHASFTAEDLAPYGYRRVRRRIKDLYSLRLQADYATDPMAQDEVAVSVDFSEWLVSLIRKR